MKEEEFNELLTKRNEKEIFDIFINHQNKLTSGQNKIYFEFLLSLGDRSSLLHFSGDFFEWTLYEEVLFIIYQDKLTEEQKETCFNKILKKKRAHLLFGYYQNSLTEKQIKICFNKALEDRKAYWLFTVCFVVLLEEERKICFNKALDDGEAYYLLQNRSAELHRSIHLYKTKDTVCCGDEFYIWKQYKCRYFLTNEQIEACHKRIRISRKAREEMEKERKIKEFVQKVILMICIVVILVAITIIKSIL